MSNINGNDSVYIRLLHSFRGFMERFEVQILAVLLCQLYFSLCLFLGFNVRREFVFVACIYLVLDALFIGARILISRFMPMMVHGQILCAVNILLSGGIAGQTVFGHRFYETVSYADSAKDLIAAQVLDTGKNILIGALLGAVAFFVSFALLRSQTGNTQRKDSGGRVMLCYILFILFAGASIGVLVLLKLKDNGTDSSNQWLGGFQPGEFLKFAFLFLLAFVSGVESDSKAWNIFKPLLQFGSLGIMLVYFAFLGEFGSLLVVIITFALFLVVANRNWIYTALLILSVLVIAVPVMGVVISKGNDFIEQKYTYTQEQKEDLAYRAENGLLEPGEEPYEEPASTFFTRQYEKIYMRFMIVKDVDGTDPDTLPGVSEALRTTYAYQPAAALKAIGISELFPFNAPVFHYVTHADTDYIYTSVLQCGGLVGIIIMMFAYLLLADSAFSLISCNCNMTNRFFVYAMVTSMLLQMFINVLGVNNLIPLTGIPLPFVSRGGSSIAACLMMIAVVFAADYDYMTKKKQLADQWSDREDKKGGVLVYEEDSFKIEV